MKEYLGLSLSTLSDNKSIDVNTLFQAFAYREGFSSIVAIVESFIFVSA